MKKCLILAGLFALTALAGGCNHANMHPSFHRSVPIAEGRRPAGLYGSQATGVQVTPAQQRGDNPM